MGARISGLLTPGFVLTLLYYPRFRSFSISVSELRISWSHMLDSMVAGIPNTGKSTIVNLLSGQKRAKTGDKAGVTRDVRWLKCGAFDLLDTPGTMPPSFDNQYHARHLAYIGSINDDILDMDDVALELLGELAEKYPFYKMYLRRLKCLPAWEIDLILINEGNKI